MSRRKVGAIVGGRYVSYDDSDRSENIAEICRTRRAPGLQGTDAINFKGVAAGDPFPNTSHVDKKKLHAQAKALGIDINGKRYMSGLVRPEYRGRLDPEAFVSSTGEVKKILETRGWGTHEDSDSMVKVKPREIEADDPLDQPYEPATDLVHEKLQGELEKEGVDKIGKKEYAKLFEKKKTQLTGDVNNV